MILQLKRLFERNGDRLALDNVIPLEELRDYSEGESFAAPISIKGSIINRAGMVSLDFACSVSFRHTCDRCLDSFVRDYSFEFEHILTKDRADPDDDSVYCEGGALDLTELTVSDIFAELPTKILCAEDCKGLCPICGKNLNLGGCGCNAEE